MGFLQLSELERKPPAPITPQCGKCGLKDKCQSPLMKPTGKGKRGILIVGEAPGADEDAQGVQFVGKTGQRLRRVIRDAGLDPNRDCWFTNALICRPPNNEIADQKMIGYCRPNLLKTIRELNPSTILLLGATAVRSLIGSIWRESTDGITRWVGWKIPAQKLNAWVCPAWHPSHVERQAEDKVLNDQFDTHVTEALHLQGRPWKEIPDFRKKVEVITDRMDAAKAIRQMIGPTPAAFDYECLVPSTKVLTDDFKWVEIGNIAVGDKLTAFEEYPSETWRKVVRGTVTAVKRFMAPCVRITTTDGRVIEASENHPWLAGRPQQVVGWLRSSKLKAGDLIRQVTNTTWKTDNTRNGGWLAGFFDGEGYVTGKVTVAFAQVYGDLFDRAMKLLRKRGFKFGSAEKKVKDPKTQQRQMMGYCNGFAETMKFVGTIRPSRLIRNLQRSIFDKACLPKVNSYAEVAKVEFIGEREVVGVTTDCGTYVAEGLCSHNTNMLKPDSPSSYIACCAISNGGRTIAYPWLPETAAATKELLLSSTPKVGYNMKFEERWTIAKLGCRVRNWIWCGMTAAHVLDNRAGITSLKFQAFVRFGQDAYDSHIKKYLQSEESRGYEANSIRQISITDLLLYCGMDAYLEWKVGRDQIREMKGVLG